MLPPDRVIGEEQQLGERPLGERATGAVSSAAKFWVKAPYYAFRWNYFHRPSVWARAAETGMLDWYGLVGFKTLFAGSGGIGYTGKPRRPTVSKFILQGGGRGLELIGERFSRFDDSRLAVSVGGAIARAGQRFRVGGIGGVVELVHRPAGESIGKFFGGAHIGRFAYENVLSAAGIGEAERVVIGDIARRAGPRAILQPGRLVPQQLSGDAARAAASKVIRFGAAANLMKGLTVGLNIALFGGMLASFSYGGMRALGELANQMRLNTRVQALEFGAGIQPFATAGGYTERQRAIQAIQESHLNARRSIGNEAAIMHGQYY